jgi:hypothetical protein
MRKQANFAAAIAAGIMTGLAVGFWIITSVDETTANFGRSKAPPTYRDIQVQPTPYLPVKPLEPVY